MSLPVYFPDNADAQGCLDDLRIQPMHVKLWACRIAAMAIVEDIAEHVKLPAPDLSGMETWMPWAFVPTERGLQFLDAERACEVACGWAMECGMAMARADRR